SGALVLSNFVNASTSRSTLDLRGFSNDANAITSNIADSGGALQITKNDGGTWVLSGANTYTGGTQGNGGFLGITSATLGTGSSSSLGVTGPSGLLGGANNTTTITLGTGTTAGLTIGMNVSGSGLGYGEIITSITNGTQFVIGNTRTTPNTGATYSP